MDDRKLKASKKVFVYGTLIAGYKNHDYLSNATFVARCELKGYGLYDLGYYPGIKLQNGSLVKGELYCVDEETLNQIDYLEGEGYLYKRTSVFVIGYDGVEYEAETYVYLPEIKNKEEIKYHEQPYSKKYVWYASYGSNMLFERFKFYIEGGICQFNKKKYQACKNSSLPLETRTFKIPFDMYFGNPRSSWGNYGVSFLDTTKKGSALGVINLITAEQLEEIQIQEGCSENWYYDRLSLGTLEGIDIITLTNNNIRPLNDPSEIYLEVLSQGIRENYHDMSEEAIDNYIKSCC